MSISVEDYIDVRQRAIDLGYDPPGEGVFFLPRNYETAASKADLRYEGSLSDVKRLLAEAGVAVAGLEPDGDRPVLFEQKAFEWLLPTLLITAATGGGATWYALRPDQVNAIVAKLWEHGKLVFTAVTGRTRIKWDVVVEEKRTTKTTTTTRTKKVSFDGPAEEFGKIEAFLKKTLQADDEGGA